jgi:hypothetical protein
MILGNGERMSIGKILIDFILGSTYYELPVKVLDEFKRTIEQYKV